MKTNIPTLAVDFDQYDPNNIDVWEEYITIGDEKERLTMAIKSANIPYLIESEKGQGKTLLTHTICKDNNIGICCHLTYLYVSPSWRKMGIASILATSMTTLFWEQFQHSLTQIENTDFILSPLIYKGINASGGEEILQLVNSDINYFESLLSQKTKNYKHSITNI